MRRFGSNVQDLDVDFAAPPPMVATDLLRRCEPLAEETVWALPVGARVEALVRLATQSIGSNVLAVPLRCPAPGCAQAIEIQITAEEVAEWSAVAAPDATVDLNGRATPIRRPTGADQRAWLAARWRDRETARRGVIQSLLDAPAGVALGDDALDAAETALSRLDPLVELVLTVACPCCGEQHPHRLDLQRSALAALRRVHEDLLQAVTRLASRFHWSERAILELPAWRRARYLALADAAS